MRCRFLPFWIQSNICKWLFQRQTVIKIISNLIHTANISNIKITFFSLSSFRPFALSFYRSKTIFDTSKLFWKYPILFWTDANALARSKNFGLEQKQFFSPKFHIFNGVQNNLEVSKTIGTCPKLLIASILARDP